MQLRSSSAPQRSGRLAIASRQDGPTPSSKGNAVRVLLVLLTAVALWLAVAPAGAAPTNTAIVGVYACSSGSCGSSAHQLSSGAITKGLLRIDVRSDDNLGGLSLVRLEAIGPGDGEWSCIRQLSPEGAKHVQTSIEWASAHWPFPGPGSGCTESQPHKHGEATLNGSYSLHVVATESGSNATQTSSAFNVRLANPPQPPVWHGEPAVAGGSVTLRWYRNPEPDVIEYRYVRTDAAGRSKTIAVDASAPTRTIGCAPEKEATFTCVDRPPGGRTRYVLQAFRSSPGGDPRCETHPVPCVGPASTEPKQVSVASGGSGPAPSASAGAKATASAKPRSPTPGALVPSSALPSAEPSTGHQGVGNATRSTPERGGPLAVASFALAALLVAHVVVAGGRGRRS